MTFAISAANDSLYNNVVLATYSGFTDTNGTITWGDGTTTVIFPPQGQALHQYASTASPFTITAKDSGNNTVGSTTATVSSVTTRSQTETFKRSGYHVEPTSQAATDAAYEAKLPTSTDAVVFGQVAGDTQQRVKLDASGKMTLGSGSATGDTTLYRSAADTLATDDDFAIATAGKGLKIKQGTNAKCGTATLNGTTAVVVNTTAVTANSIIILGGNGPAGTPSSPYVSAVVPGTSFSVKAAASDTSVIGWHIIEPA